MAANRAWQTGRRPLHRRASAFAAAVALLLFGHVAAAQPVRVGVTSEQVRTAIDRASRYLLREQRTDGSWPERPLYAGGLSPLCALALLHAGQDANTPALRTALERLRTIAPTATYTTSLQTMAFCLADAQRDRPLIERNVRWLEAHQVRDGEQRGMWAVAVPGTPDHVDNSMTHMAMLALYEAERAGVNVGDATWQMALDYWQRSQNSDGSWGWGPGYPGSGSMTCAGVASILAARSQLAPGDARVEGDQLVCCTASATNQHAERGLAWLARNFSVNRNPGTEFWHSYYLFALERVGRMTGQRFIGSHDWYREAAQTLVGMQLATGSWPSDMDEEHLADPLVATSFSLMFLAKARRPLAVGQLQYSGGDGWNPHRAATGNLVAHVERLWDLPLAYQAVELERAAVEDLLESPVLTISGREAPQLTAAAKRKLRMYVDRGGFLLAHPTCDGGTFDAGFRALVKEIFPEPESALRPLGPGHPVWRIEESVSPKVITELWGIDVSCRTAVVYCPLDLSCGWELATPGRVAAYPKAVQERVASSLALGANVLAYATNREVQFKDPTTPVSSDADATAPLERGKTYVANVLHPGGCSGAPGALWTLLRLADEELRMSIGTTPHEVSLTDPRLFQYKLLLFHGRAAFELTPEERDRLRAYVEQGGAVLADAICSSEPFAASFRREMGLTFPDRAWGPIGGDDPLWTDRFGGHDLRQVKCRRPGASSDAQPTASSIVEGPPQMEGLRIGEQYAVVFSPYDLSCALESRDPVECAGYVRADAARVVVNVMKYLHH